MDHDILLILIGAGIGLISSLLTSLFQAWLNRHEDNYRHKREKQQALAQIQVASIQDIERYSDEWNDWDAGPEASIKIYSDERNDWDGGGNRHAMKSGGCCLFLIGLVVVAVILLFVFKQTTIVISIIVGATVFILFQLILHRLHLTGRTAISRHFSKRT